MLAQYVECHSSDHREIAGRVVLPRVRVILVEDDIQWPVQVVLHAPVATCYRHHAPGGHPLRHDHVMDGAFDLAVGSRAFRFNAAKCRQIGKRGCIRRRRSRFRSGVKMRGVVRGPPPELAKRAEAACCGAQWRPSSTLDKDQFPVWIPGRRTIMLRAADSGALRARA
jgi:hypothetical protein